MESKSWTFLFCGFVAFPLLGHGLVRLVGLVATTSPLAKQFCFIVLPLILGLFNLLAYKAGSQSGNISMKRAGQQGLLIVLGFLIAVAVLLVVGDYWTAVGLDNR